MTLNKHEMRQRVHEMFRDFAGEWLHAIFSDRFEAAMSAHRERIKKLLEAHGYKPDQYELEFNCMSRWAWNRERKKDPNLPVPVITARFEWKELI